MGSNNSLYIISLEYKGPQKNIWLYSRYQKRNGDRKAMVTKFDEPP